MSSGNFLTYVINQSDNLEGIAQHQLGDWARWREIAALNNLRYPFVSDKPERWYGPESTTGILSTDTPRNSLSVRIPGERKEVIPPRSVLFLDGYIVNASSNTSYVYDALTILNYDPYSGNANLDGESTTQEWLQGTRYRVFPPPQDLNSHVARPGERILLPIAASDSGNILDKNYASSLYGSDIALSHDGKLNLVNGDLATVSGFDNAYQALRFRAELPFGSFIIHTDEGNRCFYLLGEPVRPETALRASAFVKDALETDPRVDGVIDVQANISRPDTIEISALVQLSRTKERVTINTVLRSRE
jgi:hypothetical protein